MAKQATKGQTRGESTYHTRAVSRALRILSSFSFQDFELSVADLHEKLGIHKSTLVRLLQSMAAEGFIEQNPETGEYRLGIKTFEIGRLYSRTRMMNMDMLARPSMQRLSSKLGLSANLAIRDGDEIVYVETVEPSGSPMRLAYSAGDRFGVHHTALGKALIAFLPDEELEDLLADMELNPLTPQTIVTIEGLTTELNRIREQGYAVDDEESLPGLRCVSAPIWNGERVVAALSASGSTLRVTKERVDEIAHAVQQTAREISAQLGGIPAELK
ncbi:MAG: IclR family transcriptional regulator [Anaerolineae bacterium]|jgi:IclR family acetate operon transcriptional repressor